MSVVIGEEELNELRRQAGRTEELEVYKRKLEKWHNDLDGKKKELIEREKNLIRVSQEISERSGIKMTGYLGTMKEFVKGGNWTMWRGRLEQFLEVNDISEEKKKVGVLLTTIGDEGYATLCNLCTPSEPSVKKFQELMQLMSDHLNPKPNVIAERFRFRGCKQQDGEDIKTYIERLRSLSKYCEYGVNLNENLRDQFVFGLRSDVIMRRLLRDGELTYDKAIEHALSMEVAQLEAAAMASPHEENSESAVNYIHSNKSKGKKKEEGFRSSKEGQTSLCYCCGKPNHRVNECWYRGYECNICKKEGHLAVMCRRKNNNNNVMDRNAMGKRKNDNNVSNIGKFSELNLLKEDSCGNNQNEPYELFDNLYKLDDECERINVKYVKPLEIVIDVHKNKWSFEIDTGSPISAISELVFKNSTLNTMEIRNTGKRYRSYTGDEIKPIGIVEVKVEFKGKNYNLDLFILPGTSRPIVGRDWLAVFNILESFNSKLLGNVRHGGRDSMGILDEFAELFTPGLGTYNKKKISLELKENVKPVFSKVRPVPYALKGKIEKELDRLIEEGVLIPVESSEWATPVVPVLKRNGEVRICGDYKITVNPWIKKKGRPIPRTQDLLTGLKDGTVFSKIDLTNAYFQMELDEQSQSITTIVTHKGLLMYTRLCQGLAPAPADFQNEMEELFKGMEGVCVFFDDILIKGKTVEEHNSRLREVLNRLAQAGLKLKKEKCEIAKNSVTFLGYVVDANGIHVSKDTIEAIEKIKRPSSVKELQQWLGMINYYSKFIKGYAMTLNPLFKLLQKKTQWNWSSECENAFNEIKRKLVSYDVLTHYDTQLPVKITTDASSYGIGAVLSHEFGNGVVKPIAFASRVLTKAEMNYSQLDKEALALIYGVKKFHQYVYGRKFKLETDHKPLMYIFGDKKGLPQMAATRVQRWSVILSGYDYEIKYIKGCENGSADFLSRSPVGGSREGDVDYNFINMVMENVEALSVVEIAKEINIDKVLGVIKNYLKYGWPDKVEDKYLPYKRRANELTLENECIMWGHRVVIPATLREECLRELHALHMGIVKMKNIARSYIWWPGLDNDIEKLTKKCEVCLRNAGNPPKSNLHVWDWPEEPNQRLHADFLGPINGKMYMIIIDSHSKWVDCKKMKDITTKNTIDAFRQYFCTWGMPVCLVTDNGPSFCSKPFNEFMLQNGIHHIKTAPYHPASNGAAENAVKIFKEKFQLLLKEGLSEEEAISKYLFYWRSTPHCTTGVSPAELQIKRKFRTRWDLLKLKVGERVVAKQKEQQKYFRGNRKEQFDKKEIVMTKDYAMNNWRPVEIRNRLGPVTYEVSPDNKRVWKRHVDQLRNCDLGTTSLMAGDNCNDVSRTAIVKDNIVNSSVIEGDQINVSKGCDINLSDPPAIELRRSGRVVKPRQRLDL